MMHCEKCQKPLSDSLEHYFSGYGYAIKYCAEHCPVEFDEIVCDDPHPAREPKEQSEKRPAFGNQQGTQK